MRQKVLQSWFLSARPSICGLNAAALIVAFTASIASSSVDAQVRNDDQAPFVAGAPRLQDGLRPGLGAAARPQDSERPGYRPGAFVREDEPRPCNTVRSDDRRPGTAAGRDCR